MNNYQAVIFDLDGTLVDSLMDIADSMNRTLTQFGFPTHDYNAYKYFVGNGLMNMVIAALPEHAKNQKTIELCYECMINDYRQNYANKTHLYKGINSLLNELDSRKMKLAILSNKADHLTQKVCKAILSEWNFEVILGASDNFPRKPNPESALYIAEKINIEPQNILYIGDTNIDMKTANAAGMFAVGVTWGFRTREELAESGAKLIIDKPMELYENIHSTLQFSDK